MPSNSKKRSIEINRRNQTEDCEFPFVSKSKRHPSGDVIGFGGGGKVNGHGSRYHAHYCDCSLSCILSRCLLGQSVTGWVARFGNATIPEAPSLPTLRDALRLATSKPHERLHQHKGLAAVAAGTIDRASYTALLSRLYGFHHSFEVAAQTIPERTRWLEIDLATLGFDAAMLAGLPRCTCFPAMASPDYLLGASYVVEGSALGGRGLARQLDGLLGTGIVAGRRFFSGHGTETGEVWRAYLSRLSAASTATATRTAIVAGAVATFTMFEQWLEGWNKHHE